MKLCDPDLDRQLRAGVDRYEQLPSWMKQASTDRSKESFVRSSEGTDTERVEDPQKDI